MRGLEASCFWFATRADVQILPGARSAYTVYRSTYEIVKAELHRRNADNVCVTPSEATDVV